MSYAVDVAEKILIEKMIAWAEEQEADERKLARHLKDNGYSGEYATGKADAYKKVAQELCRKI